jgi:hypothetical protein
MFLIGVFFFDIMKNKENKRMRHYSEQKWFLIKKIDLI